MPPLTPTSDQSTQAFVRGLLAQGRSTFPAIPPMVYLISLVIGLRRDEFGEVARTILVPFLIVFGLVLPRYLATRATRHAMAEDGPSVGMEPRLVRMLKLPRRLQLNTLVMSMGGASVFASWVCFRFDKSPLRGVAMIVIVGLFVALMSDRARMRMEAMMLPIVVDAFHRTPTFRPQERGFTWVRQSWSLPASFALAVVCTAVTIVVVLVDRLDASMGSLASHMAARGHPELVEELQKWAWGVVGDSAIPIVLLGLFLCYATGVTAWSFVRHQKDGARALVAAIEAFAARAPELPRWVSTDEMGDIAFATASAFDRLRQLSLGLTEVAGLLKQSAQQLSVSGGKQDEMISRQAAAIHQASATVHEIQQTSLTASTKATETLKQSERADGIGQQGERTIERGLRGVEEIRVQVGEMSRRILSLDDRARQIARITHAVKELADQSNVLALNAAIEASRSGEHGKGFVVVAREIRSLADQSIQATTQVRKILEDISSAIREAVAITEHGAKQIEVSLGQLRASEDSIRQISAIMRNSAQSVRQIAVAVDQQHTGVTQIANAVVELSRTMNSNLAELRSSREVTSLVSTVAEQVAAIVSGWERLGNAAEGEA